MFDWHVFVGAVGGVLLTIAAGSTVRWSQIVHPPGTNNAARGFLVLAITSFACSVLAFAYAAGVIHTVYFWTAFCAASVFGTGVLLWRSGWRLQRPWTKPTRAGESALATAQNPKPTPARAAPIRSIISREQEHFRPNLRMFAMRVVSTHRKLLIVFERAKQIGQPHQQSNNHQQLAAIADMVMGSMQPDLGQLEQMAQVDIEEMDQQGVQERVATFIRVQYANAQSLLALFCNGLRRGGVEINRDALDKNQELTQWLSADAECLKLLDDLLISPEANALKSARPKYFATGGRRWEQGWT